MGMPPKEIPNDGLELYDILAPEVDTTVFGVFIPKDKVEEERCVFPKSFLQQLKKTTAYYQSHGKTYTLASDSNATTEAQWTNLQAIAGILGIELLDASGLEGYPGCYYLEPSVKQRYSDVSGTPFGDYIDHIKLLLANLAGRRGYGNVLVADFDIEHGDEPLKAKNGCGPAMTYRGRHKTATQRDKDMAENSMIYVEAKRPVCKEPEEDLLEKLIREVESVLDKKTRPLVSKQFVYLKTACEAVCRMAYLDLNAKYSECFQPTGKASKDTFMQMAKGATRDGGHFLHGSYLSDNKQTWKETTRLKTIPFEDALAIVMPEKRERGLSEPFLHGESIFVKKPTLFSCLKYCLPSFCR